MSVTKFKGDINYDSDTGLVFFEDVRGTLHIIPWNETVEGFNSPRIYLQSFIKNYTWETISDFNSIPYTFGTGNLIYQVPEDKHFHFSFVLASQSLKNKPNEISCLALYVNNVFKVSMPFLNEVRYKLFSPMHIMSGSLVEIKFMPFSNKVDLGIVCGGYLIEHG